MIQQRSLTFILKEKTYKVPSTFKHLTNISPTISDSLIFNQNHSYQVESNASEEVFQSFVEYLAEGQIPEINLANINEFIELSNEFNVLKDEIETKKEEYGEYLINLNFLRFEKTKDVSKYEANVAEHLDEYIESYSSSLMQIPIQTLYNIFNHQQRRLTKHNDAYECIKTHFEKNNDSNIFILLESIDGHKLTKNNLEESISLRNSRNNQFEFNRSRNFGNIKKERKNKI